METLVTAQPGLPGIEVVMGVTPLLTASVYWLEETTPIPSLSTPTQLLDPEATQLPLLSTDWWRPLCSLADHQGHSPPTSK